MHFERNKDLAWVITFTAFLVFLLSAIACSAFQGLPSSRPQAVALANAHLNRAFLAALSSFLKYTSLAVIVYGIVAIITWPPGPTS
ncbi:MAG: hypothetical protein ACOX4B_08720 [Bacillota bacterium]|jgi:hypothetical protein|nr:hypothetical protein [Candidatus Fermentithermobacillaceae bacterium]